MGRELTNLQSGKKMGFDYDIDKDTSKREAKVKWSLTPYAYHDPSGDPGNATYHLLQTNTDYFHITYTHNGDEKTIKREPSRSFSHNGHTVYNGYADHNSYLDEHYDNDIFHDYNGNWTGIERYVKVLGTKWASGEFTVDYGDNGKAKFHIKGKFDCYSPINQSPMRFDDTINLPDIPKRYTITYKANEGTNSGDGNKQYKIEDKDIELWQGTHFSRTHFKLTGWNTQANGNGTHYSKGQTYKKNASDTLYAEWERIKYTIKYKPNGGTNSGDDDQIKYSGIDKTLFKGTKFSKPGYHLKKWNTESDGSGTPYKLEGNYTGNHDLTLYAIWEPDVHTVTLKEFDSNKTYNSFKATYDSKLTSNQLKIMNSYEVAGYELLGWSKKQVDPYTTQPTQAELSKYKWNQEGVFKETSDITLYPILKFMSTVYVRVGNEWKLAIPYIRVGNKWMQAITYIRVGNKWLL